MAVFELFKHKLERVFIDDMKKKNKVHVQSLYSVANLIIKRSNMEGNTNLTPLRLLALVYISHGCYLGLGHGPLFLNKIEAWKSGPVVYKLYEMVKIFDNDNIDRKIPTECVLSDEVEEHIISVYDCYSQMTTGELCYTITKPGTPHNQVYEHNCFKTIPDRFIEKYYAEKMAECSDDDEEGGINE